MIAKPGAVAEFVGTNQELNTPPARPVTRVAGRILALQLAMATARLTASGEEQPIVVIGVS
ncbi:hypothetical protein [uncultured Microbacterium sp.]|uniref:hypothetical protein n=1 Tax=uncultured Microbacterium sp. TaxID=191216 RepID=UPI0028F02455|nr:hypothetical protein [uncultured Microbacterium sp.]